MYVEDDADTLNAVQIILQNQGIDVIGACCGEEALSKLIQKEPDLVLLDIMLPDMSGWAVFRKIRKKNMNMKVAFISAIPVSIERLRSLKGDGVVDYITKPFDRKDLISRIQKVLTK